ncbi:VOC family protein [Arthrobacter gengyunqii]|uniref:VOC family protein n=1 Tax=Arthrobacter gengyunqii TaxID=2886940 RepID=A0A9X1S7B2_9MICC|nr:VOC family protein [Arthrobacter gengyunqii]MCC3266296.1 VOC family protein [Arthrobacter gengyunqii]MCC3269009.1 VOC family protein [Arthrobacter gengyunqii]UOY96382.1 VOC family protein [Arthrobacter gengyunqii]
MANRFSSLVLDAVDVPASARFWASALGYEQVAEEWDGCLTIAPADGVAGPPMDIVPVAEKKQAKNPLHMDLVPDGCTQEEEVERLLALGAVRADVGQGPDVSWVVLADPEGNEFCILSARD